MPIDLSQYQFPRKITFSEMIASQTATRKGIDNSPKDDKTMRNIVSTARWLQRLRDRIFYVTGITRPVIISSGFRSEALNVDIGGSVSSYHCRGLAADIWVPGFTPYELAMFIQDQPALMEAVDQLILEFQSWVHVGILGETRGQVFTKQHDEAGDTVYLTGLVPPSAEK